MFAWFRRTPTRQALLIENAELRVQLKYDEGLIASLHRERDYWRERAERYIDIGMAQAGKSHEPVMTGPQGVLDQLAKLPGLSGAGVMEIDSSKG